MDGGPPASSEGPVAGGDAGDGHDRPTVNVPAPKLGWRGRFRWWALAMLAGIVAALAGGLLFAAERAVGLGAVASWLVLVAAGLLVLGGCAFVVDLTWYVLAPAFAGRAAAWRDVGTHRLVLGSTLLVVLLANVAPTIWLLAVPSQGLCSVPGFIAAALSVDVALLGVTYVRFVRPGIVTAANLGLGIDRLGHNVALGLMVGVGVLFASALVQTLMQSAGVRQTQLVDLQCIRAFPLAGFLVVLFIGGLLAPIAEEIFFRGYVFRTYRERRGPFVAYGATSLLFALLHLNLPALLPILLMSAIFCWAYWRTRSIIPSIVGHALNNSTAFCILYFTSALPQ